MMPCPNYVEIEEPSNPNRGDTPPNEAQLVEQLRAWKDRLPAFNESHVQFGVRLSEYIVDGLLTTDGERMRGLGRPSSTVAHDLALDIAWIFWLDDRFDSSPDNAPSELLSLHDFRLAEEQQPLEVWSATRVRGSLRVGPRPLAAWELWMRSVVEMTRAFQHNQRLSRTGLDWSYAEYLDNGEVSSAVPHFVATVSLVYNLDMHERLADPTFVRMLRHLSLEMRLENDLVSSSKELGEGDYANSVLLLSDVLGLEQARAFVEQQRIGHERMALAAMNELGAADPLVQASRLILEGAHWFHAGERDRYPH